MKAKHVWSLLLCTLVLFCAVVPVLAQEEIMGEIQFSGATKVDRASGVWIDGQYVGFLNELKGKKKVVLLPGKHDVAVRKSGYSDITREVTVEPGQKQSIRIAMHKAEGATWPSITAELKLDVEPNRAAVFVDDSFVGHAGEMGGTFGKMLISPGVHRIKVALPGYRTFETEVSLLPDQKAEIKTELVKGSIEQAGPLIFERPGENLGASAN
jgi:PEGA domain